jgi:hypothetical protein
MFFFAAVATSEAKTSPAPAPQKKRSKLFEILTLKVKIRG